MMSVGGPRARRNPWVKVRPSRIDGRGLFAARTIPEGTLIGRYEGPRAWEDGPYVLWILDEAGRGYGIDGRNEIRYVNHAADPNADLHNEELYALRTIKPGEEITLDYGPDWAE